jgi:hypothetical protein
VQLFPGFSVYIEQMHFSISIGVFATYQNDLGGRYGESTASPKGILYEKLLNIVIDIAYLHSNCKDCPYIFLYFIHFNAVIDLLLCASKEAPECVDEFVVDRTGAQVMSLVFHRGHLGPLVISNTILLYRVKPLFA